MVVTQIRGEAQVKEPSMQKYLVVVREKPTSLTHLNLLLIAMAIIASVSATAI
jgi:hypothetical protein